MAMDIKALVLDVDGTLTDGKIYMSADGELMKAFCIKDGYAVARLSNHGITPIIITGRISKIVERRCAEMKIKEIYQGIEDKYVKLKDVCVHLGISVSQCAYIGDDLNDIECMKHCGYTGAPSDAAKEVRDYVDYVCCQRGGEGAVREFCDHLVTNIK